MRLSLISILTQFKDAFNFAAERETTTGDSINIIVAQAGKKVEKIVVPLRKD